MIRASYPLLMDDTHSVLIRKQLGSRIRQLREERGISLRQFALMIGTSYPYLSNVETGKQAATVNVLDRIARGLNVEIRDLF